MGIFIEVIRMKWMELYCKLVFNTISDEELFELAYELWELLKEYFENNIPYPLFDKETIKKLTEMEHDINFFVDYVAYKIYGPYWKPDDLDEIFREYLEKVERGELPKDPVLTKLEEILGYVDPEDIRKIREFLNWFDHNERKLWEAWVNLDNFMNDTNRGFDRRWLIIAIEKVVNAIHQAPAEYVELIINYRKDVKEFLDALYFGKFKDVRECIRYVKTRKKD